jgi:hypothetical protein
MSYSKNICIQVHKVKLEFLIIMVITYTYSNLLIFPGLVTYKV